MFTTHIINIGVEDISYLAKIPKSIRRYIKGLNVRRYPDYNFTYMGDLILNLPEDQKRKVFDNLQKMEIKSGGKIRIIQMSPKEFWDTFNTSRKHGPLAALSKK